MTQKRLNFSPFHPAVPLLQLHNQSRSVSRLSPGSSKQKVLRSDERERSGEEEEKEREGEEMIYRRWSLLMTPPLIVGSIVSATLFYNFYLGGNERFFRKYREQKQLEHSKAE